MHGMKSGMSGLNVALVDWLDKWQFSSKIEALLDSGFEVIITADHGNQEAIGKGWPNEGVKAETKGERVRLYKNTVEYSNEEADVLEWPAKKYGLPPNIYPLVSKGRHAFVQKDKLIVGHGGISLHEVVGRGLRRKGREGQRRGRSKRGEGGWRGSDERRSSR